MNQSFILVVCLFSLFCLAPLSVYLLWLGTLARRDRPTIVTGSWDFAGVVLGLSGFFLFGGGLVLSLLQSNFRYWMRGNLEAFRGAWASEKGSWLMLAGLYLLVVIGGIALTLASRRRSLVIYNVSPADFETTITELFENLGKPLERRGNLWVSGAPLFELDRFEAGCTVTLRWLSEDQLLFQEVERMLRESIADLAPPDNPAGRWLMACAGGAGFWAVGCFALLLVAVFFPK